jgi:hypothetical protein
MSKRFRGQNLYLFLGLLPATMLILSAVIDFGRFMLLHAQAASLADSAAHASANALDLNKSSIGSWVLEPTLARRQADNIFTSWRDNRLPYENWMQIRLERIDVVGNKVHVTVFAECSPIFLQAIGVGTYSIRVDSYARAAVGVQSEES